MNSRNKREGKFLGYTSRYVWCPKGDGKMKWITEYLRGPEGIAHLQLYGKLPLSDGRYMAPFTKSLKQCRREAKVKNDIT